MSRAGCPVTQRQKEGTGWESSAGRRQQKPIFMCNWIPDRLLVFLRVLLFFLRGFYFGGLAWRDISGRWQEPCLSPAAPVMIILLQWIIFFLCLWDFVHHLSSSKTCLGTKSKRDPWSLRGMSQAQRKSLQAESLEVRQDHTSSLQQWNSLGPGPGVEILLWSSHSRCSPSFSPIFSYSREKNIAVKFRRVDKVPSQHLDCFEFQFMHS